MGEAEPKTREQAVAFLRERGFHAFIRDWAMGETIGVVSHPSRHGDIEGWERLVYVAASSSGWVFYNLMRPGSSPVETPSLREACDRAIEALREEIW